MPYLVAGNKVLSQTPNILLYLGSRLRLAPKDEAGRQCRFSSLNLKIKGEIFYENEN